MCVCAFIFLFVLFFFAGTVVGHRFEQLARLIELVDDKSRVGVCLDTCHMFAAGYKTHAHTHTYQKKNPIPRYWYGVEIFVSVMRLEVFN